MAQTTKADPPNPRALPNDPAAEAAALGIAMGSLEQARILAGIVTPPDFYLLATQRIAAGVISLAGKGIKPDPLLVEAEMGPPDDDVRRELGTLHADAPNFDNVAPYAARVARASYFRRLLFGVDDLADAAYRGDDDKVAKVRAQLDEVRPAGGATTRESPSDLAAFLAEEEPEYDWVIPKVLERGDRVILTGPEGGGKSTLLRQIVVQGGAGIHPFTLDVMDPIRVMLVDLENSRRQVRRELRPLALAAGKIVPGTVMILPVPGGIDVFAPQDAAWLEARFDAFKPDLVVIGPSYKLATGDPTSEEVARRVSFFLDRQRTLHNFALIIEAHTPYSSGRGPRPERPYGASLWSRWPEFGLYLAPEGHLRHWRGDRDVRDWPAALERGGEWPWTAVTNSKAVTFARIVEEVHLAGHKLSVRELETRLGASKSQVQRAIDANRKQFEEACRGIDGEALTDAQLFDDNPGATPDELAERRRLRDEEIQP